MRRVVLTAVAALVLACTATAAKALSYSDVGEAATMTVSGEFSYQRPLVAGGRITITRVNGITGLTEEFTSITGLFFNTQGNTELALIFGVGNANVGQRIVADFDRTRVTDVADGNGPASNGETGQISFSLGETTGASFTSDANGDTVSVDGLLDVTSNGGYGDSSGGFSFSGSGGAGGGGGGGGGSTGEGEFELTLFTTQTTAVPLPAGLSLMLLGLCALGLIARRRTA